MKNKFFSANELEAIKGKKKEIKTLNKEDIAVIGMSGKFASTRNLEEFWALLKLGQCDIHDFPKSRLEKLDLKSVGFDEEKIIPAGYMNEIDTFDYSVFGLSKRESNSMDPAQRILLETIWEALEEAGYGGENIKGTKTGVFVGFSCDHKMDFCNYLRQTGLVAEDEISLAGNVRSVLGSRIAYLLDLKGPSMVVDTACSSVLTSVHLACNSILQGESDMAIVGGANIDILPVKRGLDDIVGIRSPENRVRAFDEQANGIASGEGSGAIILKPLEKALEDKDHIHAIIKGSAINQDGSSIGLTAPNAIAQKDVMIKAWQKAKIDPATISYIEAHGTGTKLGDPIEIDSITNAFKAFTNKKGFCAIGSVKTNIGHLDGAAGMASIIKTILMLKHQQLVASLHFTRGNEKIDFINAPVYVNTKWQPWETEGVRRCGINAFGLSGTNAHLVLEEYVPEKVQETISKEKGIFTISAKDEEGVMALAKHYLMALDEGLAQENIRDICYTSNMGRMHFKCRLAIICTSHEDLRKGLCDFIEGKAAGISYFYEAGKNENASVENQVIDEQDDHEICKAYIKGQNPKWQKLYSNKGKKVSLPTYPFKKIICWPKLQKQEVITPKAWPLLNGTSICSMNQMIYTCHLDASKWVIGEHLVNEKCVLPGTAYIEMLVEIQKSLGFGEAGLQIKKLNFMNQCAITQEESKELQAVLEATSNGYHFKMLSLSSEGDWIVHAEGELEILQTKPKLEVESLQSILNRRKEKLALQQDNKVVAIGPHWTQIEKEVYTLEEGHAVFFKVDKVYEAEAQQYSYYPSLMDRCINANIDFLKADSYFLPFNYESLLLLRPLPTALYSIVKIKAYKGEEIVVLDIDLYDLQGELVARAENYAVKRVNEVQNHINPMTLSWKVLEENVVQEVPESMVVIGGRDEVEAFTQVCKAKGVSKVLPCYLKAQNVAADFIKLTEEMRSLEGKENVNVIYLADGNTHLEDYQMIAEDEACSIDHLYLLAQQLMKSKLKINLFISLSHAYKILPSDTVFNPYHTSLGVLGKVIAQEEPKIQVKVIEQDDTNKNEILFEEVCKGINREKVGYRNNVAYEEGFAVAEELDQEPYKAYKQEGVYIITGGTGEIGKELAKYLIKQGAGKIALLSRHATAKQSEIAAEMPENQVQLMDVDLGSYDSLKQAIETLRQSFGCINGVYHCAGIVSKGIMATEAKEAVHDVLSSKIEGTIYLDLLTREDAPDFMVYFSSINGITGGVGQGDYAAANAFLDGYSLYRNQKGYKTLAINWPGFTDVGMAKRHQAFSTKDLLEGIHSKEALPFIETLLVRDEARFIVGNMKKHEKPIQKVHHVMSENTPQNSKIDDNLTPMENQVAQIWREVLEVEEVDILETFSELGGDSIMANYLYKQLDQAFPGVMDITDVFSYPTIKDMAQFIEDKTSVSKMEPKLQVLDVEEEEQSLDELLSKLAQGEISVDELL